MSTPEEIQKQAAENATDESQPVQEPADQPVNVAAAIRQLRVLVCGLGAGLLVVSLALSTFVYKQNRNLVGEANARKRQISQLQGSQQQIMYALNDLAKYSIGKPELVAIFAKHGIQITSPPGASGPSAPVAPPAR